MPPAACMPSSIKGRLTGQAGCHLAERTHKFQGRRCHVYLLCRCDDAVPGSRQVGRLSVRLETAGPSAARRMRWPTEQLCRSPHGTGSILGSLSVTGVAWAACSLSGAGPDGAASCPVLCTTDMNGAVRAWRWDGSQVWQHPTPVNTPHFSIEAANSTGCCYAAYVASDILATHCPLPCTSPPHPSGLSRIQAENSTRAWAVMFIQAQLREGGFRHRA